MSRKKPAKKREIFPDGIYNSELVAKFINRMMLDGKKGVSEKIFYQAMDEIKEKTKTDGIEIFNKAIENVKPRVEVRSRRLGGSTYQIPVEVSEYRQRTLAIRWVVTYARQRSERDMFRKLASELIDASNNSGGSIKKKEDIFKMAEANKAFAHYRW